MGEGVGVGGVEEQRSSSKNTVQEESQLFSAPRTRLHLFGEGKIKKQRSQTGTGAQFHADSSGCYVYIQSHQSQGQRRGGGGAWWPKANYKAGAQRAGTGAKTSSDSTQSDNNIYRRNRKKKDYRLQKKNKKKPKQKTTSQKGSLPGERTATGFHTRCRRGIKDGSPIQGQVSGTSQHASFNESS